MLAKNPDLITMARKLRIAIECRAAYPRQGIGTATLALAQGLSESSVRDQEYTFIVRNSLQDWLAPYIHGPCRLETVPDPSESQVSSLRAIGRSVKPLRWVWQKLNARIARRSAGTRSVPVSDGYVESREFDLVHFPAQTAYLTDLPTIYQPWDLQHLHYPQFFVKAELEWREKMYRTCCHRAKYVCVQSEWTKRDLIDHYKIAEEKVVVIPWGSVFDAYKEPSEEETRSTIEELTLPKEFFYYPAVTWPHKNHELILRALAVLKSKHHATSHVVFTGSPTKRRSILEKLARDLRVSSQVHFVGFVKPAVLQAIAKSATAMVFPSKFEGFGLPILEAFHARLPVLSSNATTLPEVARDGALYFDPDSPEQLALLMKAILDKPELRRDLVRKGTEVLSRYSINKTVVDFQGLYEKTAA